MWKFERRQSSMAAMDNADQAHGGKSDVKAEKLCDVKSALSVVWSFSASCLEYCSAAKSWTGGSILLHALSISIFTFPFCDRPLHGMRPRSVTPLPKSLESLPGPTRPVLTARSRSHPGG